MTVIIPDLAPMANWRRSFPEMMEYVTGSFSGSTAYGTTIHKKYQFHRIFTIMVATVELMVVPSLASIS